MSQVKWRNWEAEPVSSSSLGRIKNIRVANVNDRQVVKSAIWDVELCIIIFYADLGLHP